MVEKNVGGYDRIARLVLGPALIVGATAGVANLVGLAIGPFSALGVAALAGLVGLVLLVTGATQQCPLNRAFGIDTTEGDRGDEAVQSQKTA